MWPDPEELTPSYHDQFPDIEHFQFKHGHNWLFWVTLFDGVIIGGVALMVWFILNFS
jgi:hypothetical protein